jgi:hypothetical protein
MEIWKECCSRRRGRGIRNDSNITGEDGNDADRAESSAVVDGLTESTEDAIKSTLDPISSELGPGIALLLSCRQIYHESIGVYSIYCSLPSRLET